ncbi:MAG: antibiotic biosynthesis monooxygenase [Thermaceae bacterium]|nr:antibiotic biosynthesis monooxygenase [Thermaceae bacterium]
MILEAALLFVRPGCEAEFEVAFRQASPYIAMTPGYLGHELQKCMETGAKYLLLVRWETLESHAIGFRDSPRYQNWKQLLHHFYDPFPTIEHFESVRLGS